MHEVRVHKLDGQAKKTGCSIVCDKCPISFKTLGALRTHLSIDHDIQNDPIIHEFDSKDGK